MDAVHQGALTRFHDDISAYLTRRMLAVYRGESLANQDLTISCWENTQDPYTLHFDISRDKDPIFQCTLEFYEPKTEI